MITKDKTGYHQTFFLFGIGLLCILTMLFITTHVNADKSVRSGNVSEETTQTTDTFQRLLDSLRMQLGFPGATAAYVMPDGRIENASTGLADKDARTPMTLDARMLAASIGKTFVGALAAVLHKEGIIRLDTPVSHYLGSKPWFQRLPNAHQITLRHLLNHTSGLPDHVYMKAFTTDVARKWADQDNFFTSEMLVQYILDQPAIFEPGKGWHYSDTGYIIAGMAMEAAAGKELFAMITDRFLKPLKLQNTSPSSKRHLPGLVPGYTSMGSKFGFPKKTTNHDGLMHWHPSMEGAGGGLISNSHDLALWGWFLHNGKAVTPAALDEILNAVQVTSESESIGYGLGVSIDMKGKYGPVVGHGGWIPGYCSSLRYYPEYHVAIAFQVNTDIGIADTATQAMKIMEEKLAGFVLDKLGG